MRKAERKKKAEKEEEKGDKQKEKWRANCRLGHWREVAQGGADVMLAQPAFRAGAILEMTAEPQCTYGRLC